MRRNKPFIVAGNWQQFKTWCWENGLHTNDAEYVSEPHRVRGLQLHRDQIRYVGTWMDKSNAMEIDRAIHVACAFHDETNRPWSETERGKQYLAEMAEKEKAQIEGMRRSSEEALLLRNMNMFSMEELSSINKMTGTPSGRDLLLALIKGSHSPVDPTYYGKPEVPAAEVRNPRGPDAPYVWWDEYPAPTKEGAEARAKISEAVTEFVRKRSLADAARLKASVLGEWGTMEEDVAASIRPMTDPKIAAAVREVRDAARPWYGQESVGEGDLAADAAVVTRVLAKHTINGVNAAMQETARDADYSKDAAVMDARRDELLDSMMEIMQQPITNTDPNGGCFRGPKEDS